MDLNGAAKKPAPFKAPSTKTRHPDVMAKMEMAERARIRNTKDLTQLTRTQMIIRQKMVCHFNSFVPNFRS